MGKKIKYIGVDGKKLHINKWEPNKNPIGIIQIFHGMAEHGGRYKEFAEFLNKKGYIVYANDHRGHGKSVNNISKLGRIGKDGFNKMVQDERILNTIIRDENPDIPIIILGHSMGSFIAQEYIINYSNTIDGVILSGTTGKFGIDLIFGLIIAKIQIVFKDRYKQAKFLDKLTFGNNNAKIENPNTKFDWLSRDSKKVQEYIDDECCGSIFPIEFYYEFFKGLLRLKKISRMDEIAKELPIFIIGGKKDPVTSYGCGIRKLLRNYQKKGIKNIKMKLYEDGRHEMLNEINRLEVYEDIFEWLKDI
ncbi:MAG: alpha/beta hydrolase [Fusobacteriota bacterium]